MVLPVEAAEESALDMGKRPSRQRRHLPISVTSAVTSRSTSKTNSNHIPLLKMAFRENKHVKKDDPDSDQQQEEEFGASTSYDYTPSTMNNKRKKRTKNINSHNNNNNNEMKKRAQEFIENTGGKLSNNNKKKWLIWCISFLWIMFILYRIFISLKKEDYGNLSIVHFISNVLLNTL